MENCYIKQYIINDLILTKFFKYFQKYFFSSSTTMKSQNMKFCESYFQFQIFRIFWFSISAISMPSVGRWKILAKYLESLDFQIPKFTYSENEIANTCKNQLQVALIFLSINFPFSFYQIGTLFMITPHLETQIFKTKVAFLEVRHPVGICKKKENT